MFERMRHAVTVMVVVVPALIAPAAQAAPPANQPTLSIDDVSVGEGATPATFTVRLSAASSRTVTVGFATADGTATSASDYVTVRGTLKFAKGQTSRQVSVAVVGDTAQEPDETFFVRLTNARNVVVADGVGQGTIIDDDAPPPPPSVGATAYQLDAAHSGAVADAVAPNPGQAWSRDLGGPISYPLIVDGRVYVTVANETSYGTRLFALDAQDGSTLWGPVDLGGTYFWSAITADAGRIFAVNYDGAMTAFDAESGAQHWTTQLPGQYAFSSPPTARDGYVYTGGAGSGGTVYAVRQVDGSVAWTAPVANGDNSSPAVSSTGVYVSYACGQSYDFAPTTGALLWYRATPCSGGGGKTPVLGGDRLYVRDHSYPAILDAGTGTELAPFEPFGPAPAVDESQRYVLSGSMLRAEDLGSEAVQWSFSGDGGLSSAPIVAGDTVVLGSSSGQLYGLSTTSGSVTWSMNAGSGIPAPDEQNVSQPLTGLATHGGLLVVPAGSRLVAYR